MRKKENSKTSSARNAMLHPTSRSHSRRCAGSNPPTASCVKLRRRKFWLSTNTHTEMFICPCIFLIGKHSQKMSNLYSYHIAAKGLHSVCHQFRSSDEDTGCQEIDTLENIQRGTPQKFWEKNTQFENPKLDFRLPKHSGLAT